MDPATRASIVKAFELGLSVGSGSASYQCQMRVSGRIQHGRMNKVVAGVAVGISTMPINGTTAPIGQSIGAKQRTELKRPGRMLSFPKMLAKEKATHVAKHGDLESAMKTFFF